MNGVVNYLKFLISGDSSQLETELRKSKRTVTGYVDDIAASMKSLSPMLAGLFAGVSIAGFVGKLVSVQREFDVLNSSLITVMGSSAAAAREMEWLKEFAKETPYGLAQATEGFVKMKALGLNPTRESLTSFGNTASAMGKSLMDMIEAVADASTSEFERLKEFGIKSSKEGENVKFTFQGVTTTVRNSSNEITAYLEAIGNNQFAAAMAERAKTLDGQIAALGDSWDELFRTVNTNNTGGFIYETVKLASGALDDLNTILQSTNTALQDGAEQGAAFKVVQESLAVVFETVAVLGTNVKYVITGIGRELGGLAAQAAAVARGDFAGAAEIHRLMVADAQAARAQVDAQSEAILNARRLAAEAAVPKPAAGSDLAAVAAGIDSYKPLTVTDAALKDMADSLLKTTSGFKSTAESMAETSAKGGEITAMLKRLREQGLGDSQQAKQLEARLGGVNEKLKSMAEKGNGAAKSAKQLQTAYGNFISSLEEKVALEQLELDGGKKATESDKLRIKYQQDLQDSLKGLDATRRASIETKLEELAALEKQNEERKQFLALAERERTLRLEAFRAAEQTVGGLEEGNKQLREEIELIGLSAVQQQAVIMARQQAVLLVKEQQLAEMERAAATMGFMSREQIALQQEIELLKERLVLTSVKASREASAAASAESVKQWQDGIYQLGQSLTDQLMAGGQSFADYLRNLARTLVFRPAFQAGATSIFGTGAGQGASGGMLGALQSGQSLWSIFSGGTSGALAAGVAGLGKLMGSSVLAELSSGIAAGGQLGIGGTASLMGSASGTTGLGMALGAAAPWLVGGLALASAWSSLFGREHEQKNLQGTFGGDAGFTGNWHDYYRGGLFSSSKTVNTPLDEATRSGLADQFNAMRSSTEAMAQVLGLGTDAISAFTASVNIKLKDLSAEEAQQKIQEEFGKISESLARTALGTEQYSRAGETATVTLTRLSSSLAVANSALDTLGLTLYSQNLASADLASRLMEATGGTQAFAQSISAFQQSYYSEAERMEALARQLRGALSGLNLSIDPALGDEAKAQFRAAVTSALEAGNIALAAGLLDIQGAFTSVADYAQRSADVIAKAAIEQAKASAELAASLRTSLLGLEDRFVGGGFARQYRAETAAGAVKELFAGVGIEKDAGALAEQIMAATSAEVEDYFRQMWDLLDTDEARAKLVDVSNELMDLAESSGSAAGAVSDLVDKLGSGAAAALSAMNSAGSLLDRIDAAKGGAGNGYELVREQRLWAAMAKADYKQQIELAGQLTDMVLSRYQVEQQAAQKQLDFARSLRSYVDGLKLGNLSPLTTGEKLAEAAKQYQDTLAKAQAGDEQAMGALQGISSSYLDLARQYYASSDSYTQIFRSVTGSLDALGVSAKSQAEMQLSVATESLAALNKLQGVLESAYEEAQADYVSQTDLLEQQLTALLGVGDGIARVTDILAGLPAEIAANFNGLTGARIDGSHAGGLPFVPRDGYIAQLHYGERVLTEGENRVYSAPPELGYSVASFGGSGAGSGMALMVSEIKALSAKFERLEAAGDRNAQMMVRATVESNRENAADVVRGVGQSTERAAYAQTINKEATYK